MPTRPNGMVDGTHRRPFALRLAENVPAAEPVASASDADLSGWLTPADD